jgi:cobaltochelatase CobS
MLVRRAKTLRTEMNDIVQIEKGIEKLLAGSERVEVDMNDPNVSDIVDDIHKARVRLELSKRGLAVDFPTSGSTVIRIYRIGAKPTGAFKASAAPAVPATPEKAAKEPTPRPKAKRHQHTYIPPKMVKDLIDVLIDEASHIVSLVGPTQCGKSTMVKYVGRELGRKVYQINCRGDMGSEIFFGEKTITIDPATKQNVITFQKGLIEQAMTEGLDDQGNEVGPAGILFIDELPSCPSHVAHGLNRLFESDDPRRTIVIAEDGGRLVRSHSGFRIVVAGNTVGRGATDMGSAAYTAQHDALDISLLNRVAVFFRVGYDRDVEKRILAEKVGDDKVARQVLKLRDAIRQYIREGKLTSPFSTAHIVHIADMYRVFGDLGKALYYVILEYVLPEERSLYNEQALIIVGKDLLKEYGQAEVDYM